jgi:RNA polymerase primary sigma factor
MNDGEPNQIAERVKDECAGTPYEQQEKKTIARMIQQLIGTLSLRELEILRHRLGLDGESQRTLEEIGRILGLTRERPRQVQNVALPQLPKDIEKLEMIRVAA